MAERAEKPKKKYLYVGQNLKSKHKTQWRKVQWHQSIKTNI